MNYREARKRYFEDYVKFENLIFDLLEACRWKIFTPYLTTAYDIWPKNIKNYWREGKALEEAINTPLPNWSRETREIIGRNLNIIEEFKNNTHKSWNEWPEGLKNLLKLGKTTDEHNLAIAIRELQQLMSEVFDDNKKSYWSNLSISIRKLCRFKTNRNHLAHKKGDTDVDILTLHDLPNVYWINEKLADILRKIKK